ncbi:MAG: type II secretion system F family protein [Hydrogenophaga sp.]|jgi:tight adherence protein C
MHPLLLSALLLAMAAVLLLTAVVRKAVSQRALVSRLGAETGRGSALARYSQETLGRSSWQIDPEVGVLLDQLGWRRPARRAIFFVCQLGLPLLAVVLVVALSLLRGMETTTLIAVLFAAGVGYLLPKRLLVMAVGRRRERLAREVATLIPLLRMLFEVGMTVEQALRVMVTEGGEIIPELCIELQVVLTRIDAGLELGEELRAMAQLLDVDEVTDCVVILEQLIRQGGGAMASLLSLKALLDDRRSTALQEKVSKLSAKMSAVMVAFLFPALLIILAGPGFVAIIQALGDMGG